MPEERERQREKGGERREGEEREKKRGGRTGTERDR
jgi:hypothetical protein